MCEVKKFFETKLVVNFISVLIFGIVVAIVGSYLQHQNWIKQQEIASNKVRQEKMFDKRTEIASKIFYLDQKLAQHCWLVFHTRQRGVKEAKALQKDKIEDKYVDKINENLSHFKEFHAQSNSLLQEIQIYFREFPDKGTQLFENFAKIRNTWNEAVKRFKTISEKDLNNEHRKVEEYRSKIALLLYDIFKE